MRVVEQNRGVRRARHLCPEQARGNPKGRVALSRALTPRRSSRQDSSADSRARATTSSRSVASAARVSGPARPNEARTARLASGADRCRSSEAQPAPTRRAVVAPTTELVVIRRGISVALRAHSLTTHLPGDPCRGETLGMRKFS